MLGSLLSLHLHYDYAKCDQSNCVILVKRRKSLLFGGILFSMAVILSYVHLQHVTLLNANTVHSTCLFF